MPGRPTYLSDATLARASDLAFTEQRDQDTANLTFSYQKQNDIAQIQHLGDTGQFGQQSMLPPDDPTMQGDNASLGIVQTALPQIQPLSQPTPQQPAVSAPVPFPSASDPSGVPQVSRQTSASGPSGAPSGDGSGWDQRAYRAAVAAGHPNPAEFVEQMRLESGGFDPDVISGARASSAGAQGIAQIMPDVAQRAGINPLDPDAALSYAAQRMARNYQTYGNSDAALAEYNMGSGNLQQYGPRGLAETAGYLDRIHGATSDDTSRQNPTSAATSPSPAAASLSSGQNDVAQAALDDPDKWSLCGPVAAVIAAGRRGVGWTVAQAKRIAQDNNLWDAGTGMHGLSAEMSMLSQMGVPTHMGAANEQHLEQDAMNGNTPIVSTNRHYFILTGYDPETGTFDTTTTGTALAAGSRRLTLAQIEQLGGGIQGAAYMDNPASPTPSVVAPPTAGVTPAPAGSPPAPAADAPTAAGAPDPLRQQLDQSGNAGPASLKQMQPDQPPADLPYDPRADEQGPHEWRPQYGSPDYSLDDGGRAFDGAPAPGSWPGDDQNPTLPNYGQQPAPGPYVPDYTDPSQQPQAIPRTNGMQGLPPDAMYRQPLASNMGPDTATGDQQPYDPDQGPHEAGYTVGGVDPSGGATQAGGQAAASTSQTAPASSSPQAPSGFPGLQAVYDSAGNFLHWIQGQAQGVQNQIDSQMAGPVQSTPGEPDYVPPSNPVQRWIDTPIAQPPDQAPPSDPALAAGRLYMPPYPQSLVPRDVGADIQRFGPRTLEAVREAAQAVQQSSTDTQQAISQGDLIGTIWNGAKTAIGALNVPFTGVTSSIDNALPSYDVNGTGFGTALGDAQVAVDVGHALAVGIKITPKVVAALRAGVPVDRLIELAGRGLNSAADAIDRGVAAGRGALADAAAQAPGEMQLGSGFVPQRGQQTAEVLQQRLTQARNIVDRLIGSGDQGRLAAAQDNAAAIENQLTDAVNARRALEPRITSDVGARESALPPSEQTVENRVDAVTGGPQGAINPQDLSGPVSIPTDTGSRLNAGVGARPGSGIASTAFNGAQGGVFGAYAADQEDQRRQAQGLPPLTPTERVAFMAGGAGLAVLAGRHLPAGEGARLGSGVVPEGGRPPLEPGETFAFGSKPGTRYQFQVKVVPMDDLVTSHTNALTENPAFPQELQPRDRQRAASRIQVDKIVSTFDPEQYVVDSHRLDSGPAIVGPDGVVESGNGRTIALRRVAEEHPEAYARYVDAIKAELPRYGLPPDALDGIEKPVLVRERVSQVDRPSFTAEANNRQSAGMGPLEQATQDAGRISDTAIARIQVGDDQTIDEALLHPGNSAFVRSFMGTLPDEERGLLLDAQGNLNADGLKRVKSALLVKTYGGDAAGARIAASMIESAKPDVRNVQNGIMGSLPGVARAESLISSGQRDAGLSIADDVAKAVDVYTRLRQARISVGDYLAQASMFGDRETTPFQDRLLGYFNDNARSGRRIRALLDEYAGAVESMKPPEESGGMFGDAAPVATKEDVLDGALRRLGADPSANLGATGSDRAGLEASAGRRIAVPEYAADAQAGGSSLADQVAASETLTPEQHVAQLQAENDRLRAAVAGTAAPRAPRSAPPMPAALPEYPRPGPVASDAGPSTGGPQGRLEVQNAPLSVGQRPGAVPADVAPTGGPAGRLESPNGPQSVGAQPGPVGQLPTGGPQASVSPLGTFGAPASPIGQHAAAMQTAIPPNVANAVSAAQARQARTGLDPLTWMRKLAAQVSYSSLIGPTAGSAKLFGDLGMAVGSHPKELTRALGRGAPAEYPQFVAGGWDALTHDAWPAVIDAIAGRGQYGSHGGASLSAQTQNPVGKAVATSLEAGGRLFMGVPTAIFGEAARGAGERLKAAQIATDAVRSGQIGQADWQPLISALTQDAADVRAGGLPRLPMTQDVIQAGADFGKRQTFQNPVGPVGQAVSHLAGAKVWGPQHNQPIPVVSNFLNPIFGVPWNMHARLAEGSPLGLAREGVNLARGKGTNFDKMYDAVTGSAVIGGLGLMADQGVITGNGPSDPQQRQKMISQGWQPYSTLVHGVYVPNKLLYGYAAPAANMAGDIHDAVAYRKAGTDAISAPVGLDAFSRIGAQLRQEAFLQPLADALSAVGTGAKQSIGAGAAQFAASTIDRAVPYGGTLRAIGTSQDTVERRPDGGQNAPFLSQVAQRAEAGVGIRSAEAPSQDVLGRPVPNQQQGIGAFFPRTSTARPDPVLQAFEGAGVGIPGAPATLNLGVSSGDSRSVTQQIPMTPDEQRAWNAARGEGILRQITPALLASPKWQQASAADRQLYLQARLRDADEYAKTQVQNQIGVPELRRRIATLQKAS